MLLLLLAFGCHFCAIHYYFFDVYDISVGLGCQIGLGDLVMSGQRYRVFGQDPEPQPQTFF